ncbi:lantibiotic dehydratase [Paenibacillus sp. 23TSA30-6]|uniref:lantibiotic dehydratase n=1 Tax=Paenibacillus sp. 23TSA30-6 TaxID=2546104 RepID=UPI001EE315D0|nr:lantibiotic dehydratase [Paenibacillus sp. 23TSA30-6]
MDKFMVRIPLKDNRLDFLDNEDQDYLLTQLCKDPIFKNQVLVSSKTLYDTMELFLNKPEKLIGKKKRNFIESMLKYAIRRASRTTPFGLFSSVGVGSFASENQLQFDQHAFYKKARVDLEWLFNMIKKVEIESADQLEFKLNSACYVKGDRAFLLYSTDGKSDEINIRATPVFSMLYDNCKKFILFQDITRMLSDKYPNTDEKRIKDYVMELIDKEFLISNLRPPLTVPDQYQYFIEQAERRGVAPEMITHLKEIQIQLEYYNQLLVGQGEREYINLYENMNRLMKSSSPLQLDAGLSEANFRLDHKTATDVCNLASMLTMIARPFHKQSSHLEHYKHQFLEKYGTDREVSIMEMLDSSSGIGAPYSYMNPPNDFHETIKIDGNYTPKLKNFFLEKYYAAVRSHGAIELHENELRQYYDPEIDHCEIPVSLELNFFIKSCNQKMVLYMGPNVGSTVAGKTFGRFSHLSKEITEIIKDLNDKEKVIRNGNCKLCELSFVPNQIRSGNVTRNLSNREKEMSLFTNGVKSEQDMVKLEDILIGIYENRFYARHKITKDILLFESNNMLNPLIASNAIRFLQEIALDGKRDWSLFPWTDIYKEYKYIPEIRYENIILSSAQWNICQDDLHVTSSMGFEEFKSSFLQYYNHYGLPEKFYIANADNRLLIHAHNNELLKILYSEIKKEKASLLNLVAIEQGEDVVIDQYQHSYVAEIVVPLMKRIKEEKKEIRSNSSMHIGEDIRVKMPFDDWLFIKLYAKQRREEELIAFEIADFCESLSESYSVQHFFIRYLDPKPHIRLRFHGNTETLFEIYPHILKWLKNLRQRDIVTDGVIGSYDRELERYGGPVLMDAAEQIFFTDSKVVECILRMTRMKHLTLDKELIGMISIIKYLDQFGLDFEAQLNFLEGHSNPYKYRTEFKDAKDTFMSSCNNDQDWAEVRKTEEGNTFLNILELRDKVVDHYSQLAKKQMDSLTSPLDHILASIIHLHCNRLFGTNRDLEDKIMCLTRHTLYAQRYQKSEGRFIWK